MPPRFGKSRTLVNFCIWAYGIAVATKIITASYNASLGTEFSRYTRDGIGEEQQKATQITANNIFPHLKLKHGNKSVKKWALDGQFFSYLGTSVNGTVTGVGGDLIIIDDPVKNSEEAYNDDALAKIYSWYTNTMLSRVEEGGKIIVCMTRWSTKDLCGRIDQEGDAENWYTLKFEAMDESTGELLCPELLSLASYNDKKTNIEEPIFDANYHQRPVDIKGVLYNEIKTYDEIPRDKDDNIQYDDIIAYVDTADEGSDFLCAIAGYRIGNDGYITDIYYTKLGMEITEPETADFINRNGVLNARIESNNGGRGFARAVKKEISEKYPDSVASVKWFTQTRNKIARILSNSNYVMKHVYFPSDWETAFPQFARDIKSFQREGNNKHDDAPDALTGFAEMLNKREARIYVA